MDNDGAHRAGESGMGATRSAFAAPNVALPKGGGALRGINETFAADLATGTGSLQVPIRLSAGRAGSGPQLTLSYNSGTGNSLFGMGWRLSLPSITRRTDKGLPRYDDAPILRETSDTDIFLLSSAEDLVPVLEEEADGGWRVPDTLARRGYTVQAYRPRIEGLFARIERWTRLEDGDTHWRSISHDNVLSLYGLDPNSRITDPDDPHRVFSWLIARTYANRGEAIAYDYAGEDDYGIELDRPSERRRKRCANRYLRRIRWGNRTPQMLDPARPSFRPCHLDAPDPDAEEWLFSAVLDYDEGRYEAEPPDDEGRVFAHATAVPSQPWRARPDPFSSYRPGFELRTHRLCRRVLMFHHMPEELGTGDCLVASTAFAYHERPAGSLLARVEQCGHTRQPDGRYLTSALPPLDLGYTESPLEVGVPPQFVAREMDAAGLDDLPGGVDGTVFRWLDLNGEGLSGVLSEQGGAWLYKPNLGEGRLGPVATVPMRPTLAGMPSRMRHLMDVDGDGLVDLLDLSPTAPGYHGRDLHAGWLALRTFRDVPVIDWNDPDLRFIDMTGDGIADVLITRDAAFDWRPSRLQEGFGAARRVDVPTEDEASGPRLLLAEATETIFLADMTGDGLTDLVRVCNGEACYWPNRGYGRFGTKVAMERAPWFDTPDLFDPRRLRLADVDGTGNADIVYLGGDGVTVFLNESGNGWSSARHITGWPANDSATMTDVIDLLGRGTACLVWSSKLPRDAGRQVRYIDLMCGRKPHLLCCIDGNMGAVKHIEYAASTEFYSADKAAGTPWITRLPFPVHVVRRVEMWDAVSRNRIVTTYSYHHGYYDGLEREFRGFGRVDQLDTEDIASLTPAREDMPAENWNATTSVPPVLTRTWFHTGVFIDGTQVSRQLAHEYFNDRPPDGDTDWLDRRSRVPLLADTILPPGLSGGEAREACRALKGAMLRREVYARDGTVVESTPYAVEEHNFTIVTVQPRGANRYAALFTHLRESISLHYERDAADPRIAHNLRLLVDAYGNVLREATIGYARRAPSHEEQARALATMTERRFTNAVLLPDAHRTPLTSVQTTFQLTAPTIAGASPLGFAEIAGLTADAQPIDYREQPTDGRVEKRLVAAGRTRYRADDLSHLLPEGEVQALALPGEADTLALSDSLFDLFAEKAPPDELRAILTAPDAGYRDLDNDGRYWAPSGRVFYARAPDSPPDQELAFALRHFFLPHRYSDPFGNETVVAYDHPFDLAPVMTRDAAGNVTRAELDYRVLAPRLLIDPNGNRSAARYDALGLLAGTAIAGKADGPVEGDSFDQFTADLAPAAVARYFDASDPRELAHAAIGTATARYVYDFTRLPACVATIARQTHVSDLASGERSRLQLRFLYADGFGREAQTRTQAEPGPLDPARPEAGEASPRWVATGAKIYNNKGKPVRQYEPFFSAAPQFGIERWGVSSILLYDPLERVVATLHPNHTFDKVTFDAWSQTEYDANDTVTFDPAEDRDIGDYIRRLPDSDYRPGWYAQRINGALGPDEQAAARQTARHSDTPTRTHLDVLGRAFLHIADNGRDENGVEQLYATRTALDIKGAPLAVIDALGRAAMRENYDLAGAKLRERSMEAGTRWILRDAVGKPLRNWNSRNYAFRTEYDALHRPVRSFVRGGDAAQPEQYFPEEILFERMIYGDTAEIGLSEAERMARNLRGKVLKHFDGAGVVDTDRFDFKGNSLTSARQFAEDFKVTPDWSTKVTIEAAIFCNASAFDALNRAVAITTPDGSIYRPTFNEASLLRSVDVALRGAVREGKPFWMPFVTFINYDAKGQRTFIGYANGATTTYDYDTTTFRLIYLRTSRQARDSGVVAAIFKTPEIVQELRYTYDPVGNITRIEDAALKTVFHANHRVDATNDYTYDPLYRLLDATGRENAGQSAFSFAPKDGDYRDFPFVGAARQNNLQALRRYVERYDYDPVGNFRTMAHHAEGGNWDRGYAYDEPSLVEPGKVSNRLSRTSVEQGPSTFVERYRHDAHGNMSRMPHLPRMRWDFLDQMRATTRQVLNEGTPEETWYVYDSFGQRARKVTTRREGGRKSERLYLDGLEVFRTFNVSCSVELERETLHVMDDKTRLALVETLMVDDGEGIVTPNPMQRYQLANHLGSASLELGARGELISYEEYSPYGNSTFQAGRTSAEVSLKRYRYTSKERDEETGFTYHGARYYSPWLGRWTSCDPLGLADSLNTYRYAMSNPSRFTDSTGAYVDPNLFIDNPNADPAVIGGGLQWKTESGKFASMYDEPLHFEDNDQPAQQKPASKPPPAKAPPKPKAETPQSAPEPVATPKPPSEQEPAGATTDEKIGAFAKGAAEGLATGIAVEAGVGFVAGLGIAGLTASTLGIGLLVIGVAAIAYHWDDITAAAGRLAEGKGTLEDYEGLGNVAGGLLSGGAAKPASEVGGELAQAARNAVKDALDTGLETATAGGPKINSIPDNALATTGSGARGAARFNLKVDANTGLPILEGEIGSGIDSYLNGLGPNELSNLRDLLEISIKNRQAGQAQLGETTTEPGSGFRIGARHRTRVGDEVSLLNKVTRLLFKFQPRR